MNIIVTGSLGHISKPLTQTLIQKGHSVTLISSNPERQKDIEAIGAQAAIGSIDDAAFLSDTFSGADIAYCMEPPINFFDQKEDMGHYWLNIAHSYRQAIKQSGITKIIHLSSIGAHTDKGVGMLKEHKAVEDIFKTLPDTVSIKFIRPVGFYYNIFAYIPTIKNTGAIIQNYGGDRKDPWVSPLDIAATIAEEMEKPFSGRSVHYIASDEISPNELAKLLGEAINKPDLKWKEISDEEFLSGLIQIGMNPDAAQGFTEMNAGRKNGVLYEDYNRHKPVLGKVKLKDFTKNFAAVYNQQ